MTSAHEQVCTCEPSVGYGGERYPTPCTQHTCYACVLLWNLDAERAAREKAEVERDAARAELLTLARAIADSAVNGRIKVWAKRRAKRIVTEHDDGEG